MPRESFVVWMDEPLDPSGSRSCTGRVEHVATSERLRFDSAEELIAFLTRGPAGTKPDSGSEDVQ